MMRRRSFLLLALIALIPRRFRPTRAVRVAAWDGRERRRPFLIDWRAGGRRTTDRAVMGHLSTYRFARGTLTFREVR